VLVNSWKVVLILLGMKSDMEVHVDGKQKIVLTRYWLLNVRRV
jgi:hypothetical protein